jgi:hypothetical protein
LHSLCILLTSSFLLQAFSYCSSHVIFRMSRSSCRLSACIRASYWAPVRPCVVWKRISVNYYTMQKPPNRKHQTNNFDNNLVTLAANYKRSRRTNHDTSIHIGYSMTHTSAWTFLFSQRHATHKEFPHSHFYLPPYSFPRLYFPVYSCCFPLKDSLICALYMAPNTSKYLHRKQISC